MTQIMKPASERKAEIMRLLAVKPMTNSDIAREIGLSASTTHHYVMSLYDEKKIYISEYVKAVRGGKRFAVGNQPDATWKKATRKRKQKAQQKPKRVFVDDFERKPFVVVVRREPLHAALFGEYRRAA